MSSLRLVRGSSQKLLFSHNEFDNKGDVHKAPGLAPDGSGQGDYYVDNKLVATTVYAVGQKAVRVHVLDPSTYQWHIVPPSESPFL